MNHFQILRHEISDAIDKLQAMYREIVVLESEEANQRLSKFEAELKALAWSGRAPRVAYRPKTKPIPAPRARRAAAPLTLLDMASDGSESVESVPVPRKRGRPRKVTPPPESSATSLAAGHAGRHGSPIEPEPRIPGAGFEPA